MHRLMRRKSTKRGLNILKSAATLLKPGLTINNFNHLDNFETVPLWDIIEAHFMHIHRDLKDQNTVMKKLYRQSRRHSIHLDEILAPNPEPKNVRKSRLNNFLKQQNIVLNRMDLFRAQKYWNQEEINFLEKKRTKSWSSGEEGLKLLILTLRNNVHKSDVKIFEKRLRDQRRLSSIDVEK